MWQPFKRRVRRITLELRADRFEILQRRQALCILADPRDVHGIARACLRNLTQVLGIDPFQAGDLDIADPGFDALPGGNSAAPLGLLLRRHRVARELPAQASYTQRPPSIVRSGFTLMKLMGSILIRSWSQTTRSASWPGSSVPLIFSSNEA